MSQICHLFFSQFGTKINLYWAEVWLVEQCILESNEILRKDPFNIPGSSSNRWDGIKSYRWWLSHWGILTASYDHVKTTGMNYTLSHSPEYSCKPILKNLKKILHGGFAWKDECCVKGRISLSVKMNFAKGFNAGSTFYIFQKRFLQQIPRKNCAYWNLSFNRNLCHIQVLNNFM